MKQTTFQRVSAMNVAFGNPKGDPLNIDWDKVRRQFKNVGHEFCELLQGLGLNQACVENILGAINRNTNPEQFDGEVNLTKVRDSSRDIVVFADGGHHFMGIDGDRDMNAVIDGVMTRFIKDEADKQATIEKHAAAGVTDVYFEGEYPTMIMKSGSDQDDAPKGKFLKWARAIPLPPLSDQLAPPSGLVVSNRVSCVALADEDWDSPAREVGGELIKDDEDDEETCDDPDCHPDECDCPTVCSNCDDPVEDCECDEEV
jgi:hypothetical protein